MMTKSDTLGQAVFTYRGAHLVAGDRVALDRETGEARHYFELKDPDLGWVSEPINPGDTIIVDTRTGRVRKA